MRPMSRRGSTFVELLVVCVAVALLLAVSLPVLARVRGDSGVAGSMDNLATLAIAHVLYAGEWGGRQVTWVVDDLAEYGSVDEYNQTHGCDGPGDAGCHPGVIAGYGCDGHLYGYHMHPPAHHWAHSPINFEGAAKYFGNFRFANFRPLHMYVTGRCYDPVFYAPKDSLTLEEAAPAFEEPCEFPQAFNAPIWTSYALSPAAMFHPGVLRANAEGGWQSPWDFAEGFESPGFFQAKHPALKSHMIEHAWLQNAPPGCNDDFYGFGSVLDCEPYYFNHGIDSAPVTLFYDGSVRLLPNTEVLAADQMILKQTGGEDGLWHRGTPFGENGYWISEAVDGTALSHHILTTGGILGRDTIAGPMPAAAVKGKRAWIGGPGPPSPSLTFANPFSLVLTAEDE